MTVRNDCIYELTALLLLSLVLLISLCFNVAFCFIRKALLFRDGCCSEGESLSRGEGRDLNHQDWQKNVSNHTEQQDNPIYGNISTEPRDSLVCNEMMTMQHAREQMEPSGVNLNYASLDLRVAKKCKKKRHNKQGQTQGPNNLQDQLPVHLTPPANTFLDVGADMDAYLPSRDTSPMASLSSIYLNSQQIAQESKDMMERGNWEGKRGRDDEGSREGSGARESEKRTDQLNNGSV
ncbi:uncharacterized protein ACBR49_009655 [Aulostomus maculatus]